MTFSLTIKCEIQGVSKHFLSRSETRQGTFKQPKPVFLEVLENINFSISKGEFVSIVGPSGCGKSTLLRIIAGLERPTSGQVMIDERKVEGPREDKGFIFQAVGLYPWRNTIQNVEFFLELRGVKKEERHRIAMDKLGVVGLSEFANYSPVQLSGGMQQRVAIARALTVEPSILLMDEPFGALDALSREKAQKDLLDVLSKDRERSILFVTHSIDEAVFLSNTVVVFTPRPGRVRKIFQVDLGDERRRADRGIRTEADFTKSCADVRQSLIEEQVL